MEIEITVRLLGGWIETMGVVKCELNRPIHPSVEFVINATAVGMASVTRRASKLRPEMLLSPSPKNFSSNQLSIYLINTTTFEDFYYFNPLSLPGGDGDDDIAREEMEVEEKRPPPMMPTTERVIKSEFLSVGFMIEIESSLFSFSILSILLYSIDNGVAVK